MCQKYPVYLYFRSRISKCSKSSELFLFEKFSFSLHNSLISSIIHLLCIVYIVSHLIYSQYNEVCTSLKLARTKSYGTVKNPFETGFRHITDGNVLYAFRRDHENSVIARFRFEVLLHHLSVSVKKRTTELFFFFDFSRSLHSQVFRKTIISSLNYIKYCYYYFLQLK